MRVTKPGDRGFKWIKFKDIYGEECSMSESSLATDCAIWFGTNEAKRHPATGELLSPRMHLNQKKIKELLPILHYFADWACLPDSIVQAKRYYEQQILYGDK